MQYRFMTYLLRLCGESKLEEPVFNWKYTVSEVLILNKDEHGNFTFQEYLQHYEKINTERGFQ